MELVVAASNSRSIRGQRFRSRSRRRLL